jgi:hypothetical protein
MNIKYELFKVLIDSKERTQALVETKFSASNIFPVKNIGE